MSDKETSIGDWNKIVLVLIKWLQFWKVIGIVGSLQNSEVLSEMS